MTHIIDTNSASIDVQEERINAWYLPIGTNSTVDSSKDVVVTYVSTIVNPDHIAIFTIQNASQTNPIGTITTVANDITDPYSIAITPQFANSTIFFASASHGDDVFVDGHSATITAGSAGTPLQLWLEASGTNVSQDSSYTGYLVNATNTSQFTFTLDDTGGTNDETTLLAVEFHEYVPKSTTLTESISVADTVATSVGTSTTLTESISVADTVDTDAALTTTLTESISVADTVATARTNSTTIKKSI